MENVDILIQGTDSYSILSTLKRSIHVSFAHAKEPVTPLCTEKSPAPVIWDFHEISMVVSNGFPWTFHWSSMAKDFPLNFH